MTVIPNTRWTGRAAPAAGYEPAEAAPARMLLLLLSRHRALTLDLARLEAEIALHSRAFADAQGEFFRPTIPQLRTRLGIKP